MSDQPETPTLNGFEFHLQRARDLMGPLDAQRIGINWQNDVLLGRPSDSKEPARWVEVPADSGEDALARAADEVVSLIFLASRFPRGGT